MAELKTVELHAAFIWTCEECGRDNFERSITVSAESVDPEDILINDPEMAESVREWLESGESGDFVRAPGCVTCPHCKSKFNAEPT